MEPKKKCFAQKLLSCNWVWIPEASRSVLPKSSSPLLKIKARFPQKTEKIERELERQRESEKGREEGGREGGS